MCVAGARKVPSPSAGSGVKLYSQARVARVQPAQPLPFAFFALDTE